MKTKTKFRIIKFIIRLLNVNDFAFINDRTIRFRSVKYFSLVDDEITIIGKLTYYGPIERR